MKTLLLIALFCSSFAASGSKPAAAAANAIIPPPQTARPQASSPSAFKPPLVIAQSSDREQCMKNLRTCVAACDSGFPVGSEAHSGCRKNCNARLCN